ncbi:MAG: sigma-70 family RNA polymerase sigma factor, partial [Phycisphaerales bacterium]|nr:sigma-70 family RNA polymerase sigma factor [Phycisphaerales bacterium]
IRDREDHAAWETYDAIYRPMLVRFAVAQGLGGADVDDVVQHCMRAIAEHVGAFEYDPERGRFKAWLKTVAANHARNLRRRRTEVAIGDDMLREMPDLDETFDRLWDQEHLWNCLRRLAAEVEPRTFEAFRMHVIEDRPVEAVAAELGLDRNNLYTIKWRLTSRLGDLMREVLGDAG